MRAKGGCPGPGAENQEGRPDLGLNMEAAEARTPGEERVGKEALEMVVVLGTRTEEGALGPSPLQDGDQH